MPIQLSINSKNMSKLNKILLAICFVSNLSISNCFAQEKYSAKVVDGPNFASDLFYSSQQRIINQVPHLKNLDLKFGLANWYFTTTPSVAAATSYINVELNTVNYIGFVMKMPNGADKRVTLSESGIIPSGYNIVDIKLNIEFGKIGVNATTEIDFNGSFNKYSKGSGSLRFKNSEDFNKFSKFISDNKLKTTQEIFSALNPQVTFTYRGSFNGSILSEYNTFLLRKIDNYIQKIWLENEKENKINTILRSANTEAQVGNLENAKSKFEEAYQLKADPNVLNEINRIKQRIKEKKEAEEKANEINNADINTNTSNTSSNSQTKSTATNSSSKTASSTTKKETTTEKKDAYATKSNTIGNTGKTYEQLEYERRASERQQKEKLQQAVNPGGYAMQQSGANDFYKNEIARLNKESDLRREREEREWEAEKRRIRKERIEEARKADAYRKQLEEEKRKYNLSIEEAYQKKGGDANYNAKLKELETKIFNTINEINAELKRNGNNFKSFYYSDNCSYVTIIETIQKNKKLSKNRKLILIEDILALKTAYANFYENNSKHGQDYGKNPNYQDNTTNAACSEYLRIVANSLLLNYQGKWSNSISNTNIDFTADYKNKVADFQSRYVFDYYTEGQSSELKTRGVLTFKLEDYIDFYLENSWTKYGANPPETAPKILNERADEVNKVKLTHNLGRTYHTTKNIDELTMAVFNYNHGFCDDAFNHYKTYELKASNEKTMAKDVKSVTSPSVISKLLGAILYIDNKDYKQALILLTRLRKFYLPLLKKRAEKYQYFEEDESLEHAILKLENIIFYEVGNYKEMWLPKNEEYFKGGTSRLYNFKLLEYYNPGLLAEALYKTGNENFAEEVMDFVIDYYKKIYKYERKYRGTRADVDAFKRMLQIFNPKALEKMTFSVEHKYQLFMGKGTHDYKRLLHWKFYPDYGNPLNITPIDLQNESSWLIHKENVGKLLSKEELHTVFNEQLSIYNKGKLDVSDESKAFLASLVKLGIWSGNFYEVMPAMWDLKNNYDTEDYLLFEQLLMLMTLYKEDLSIHHFHYKEENRGRLLNWVNSYIEWFVENGKKPDIKKQINDILEIWNSYDYAHLLIPFLYEL